jgi:glycosyltransferase involved in cell wall biosynthesis
VNYTQTTDFYRQARVLVNPSLSESFGMSLVEAMMHRLPVIATRIGGMPFIVEDGSSGHLVEPANPAALARAICDILENPEKARDMGRIGRQIAESRFTWEKSADTLLHHYQTLLQ